MAVIERFGGSSSQAFEDEADIRVFHWFGRRPVVQVLVKNEEGPYGIGEFGTTGYGDNDMYVVLPDASFSLYHEDADSFRVLMDGNYTGEVLYV